MGILATLSGATRDLFSSAQVLFGNVRGGIGIATVWANAVFASITGVSVASAAVFSKVAIPEMRRLDYDRKFSYGIVGSSAVLGMLIPPSILMIVYGVLTEQSIGKLFAAGIGPGLLVTVLLILGIWLRVYFSPGLAARPQQRARLTGRRALQVALKPWGVFLLVALVLGGLYGGFFTPTEAGGIGAAGAMVLVIANRRLNCLLLTIPIMFPVIVKLGYDPIWFGMVAIVAVEVGMLTPPFGMVAFAMKSALGSEATIEDIFAGNYPFLLVLFMALAIVVAVPALSTWLPSVMLQ